MIITIARQHGSSGREIARALSEDLGIQCFDKEIVDEAAENSSICKELISSFDEKRVSPFMLQTTQYPSMNYGLGLNIQVASAQFDVIRKLADQGDCIFVGRCADYILRERKDLTRVFIMGEQEDKIRCIMNRQQISESEAKKKIKQVDKDRSSYYKYYTDQIWGESENYDLCINSSKIGITGTVNVIKAYIENNK